MARQPPSLSKWCVRLPDGSENVIESHYLFSEEGQLIFRRYNPRIDRFDLIAGFAPGGWHSYKLIEGTGNPESYPIPPISKFDDIPF